MANRITKRKKIPKKIKHIDLDKLSDEEYLAFMKATLRNMKQHPQLFAGTDMLDEFEKKIMLLELSMQEDAMRAARAAERPVLSEAERNAVFDRIEELQRICRPVGEDDEMVYVDRQWLDNQREMLRLYGLVADTPEAWVVLAGAQEHFAQIETEFEKAEALAAPPIPKKEPVAD